jgi:hypothetical protein
MLVLFGDKLFIFRLGVLAALTWSRSEIDPFPEVFLFNGIFGTTFLSAYVFLLG